MRAEFTWSKPGPRFGEQFWIRRRRGLPSCIVGHDNNIVYKQNIAKNPCSRRYVDGNISNTLMGTSVTYRYDSLILNQHFGRVRAYKASVESFMNSNKSSYMLPDRDRTFTLNGWNSNPAHSDPESMYETPSAWNPCFRVPCFRCSNMLKCPLILSSHQL